MKSIKIENKLAINRETIICKDEFLNDKFPF